MFISGVVCYICGKEYGTHSLEIHLKTCKKKWEEQEAGKPPEERKPVPEPPKSLDDVSVKGAVGGKKQMDAYNEEAYKDWTDKVLEPCPNCGRKFLADRLVVHLRSCKTPKTEEHKSAKAKNLMPSSKVLHEKPGDELEESKQPKKEKKKPESLAAILRAARLAGPAPKYEAEVSVVGGGAGGAGPGIGTKAPTTSSSAVIMKKKAPARGMMESSAAAADSDRKACPLCNRKFAPDRFDVHYNICSKHQGAGPAAGNRRKGSGSSSGSTSSGMSGAMPSKSGFKASYE